ncbi:MAG: hypothetical protein U0930_21210 [Pirellulales bacterium]
MPDSDTPSNNNQAGNAKKIESPKLSYRWRRLLIVFIILGGASLGSVEFYLRRPMGEGPAGPKIDPRPSPQHGLIRKSCWLVSVIV